MKKFFGITKENIFFLIVCCSLIFCQSISGKPPAADLILTGNLQSAPAKNILAYVGNHNPYSIWIIGGNVFSLKELDKKNITEKEKEEIWKKNRLFMRSFPFSNPILSVLGRQDFYPGLHKAVSFTRSLRYGGTFVLDYIGAENNENPYLLKYVDILVNGKTLRFMGLGAWENLYPKKKDVLYRKGTAETLQKMGEYMQTLKKADFTVLLTAQNLKYDKQLAATKQAKEFFDLIISNDPACPLLLEEKNSIPVAGSGKELHELRKIFFNPVKDGIGGPRIQAWVDESYQSYYEKIKAKSDKNKTKTQEKKKK